MITVRDFIFSDFVEAGLAGDVEHLLETMLGLEDGLGRVELEFGDEGASLADRDQDVPLDLFYLGLVKAVLRASPGQVEVEFDVGLDGEELHHFVCRPGDHPLLLCMLGSIIGSFPGGAA